MHLLHLEVGGFFAHVGQLYMVFHIWAYEGMFNRQQIRQNTWAKPGWDSTVAYTGFLTILQIVIVNDF